MGPDRYIPVVVFGYRVCLNRKCPRTGLKYHRGESVCDAIHLNDVPETLPRKRWSYTEYVIRLLEDERGFDGYYGPIAPTCKVVTLLPCQFEYYRGDGPIYEDDLLNYGFGCYVGIIQTSESAEPMELDQLMTAFNERIIKIPEMEGLKPKIYVGVACNQDKFESIEHMKFRQAQEALGKEVCYDTDDEEKEDRKARGLEEESESESE